MNLAARLCRLFRKAKSALDALLFIKSWLNNSPYNFIPYREQDGSREHDGLNWCNIDLNKKTRYSGKTTGGTLTSTSRRINVPETQTAFVLDLVDRRPTHIRIDLESR